MRPLTLHERLDIRAYAHQCLDIAISPAYKTAFDIITQMRALLSDENGWCQGDLTMPGGNGEWSFCLVGAWDEAAGIDLAENVRVLEVLYLLLARKPRRKGNPLTYISRWNDRSSRTHKQVVALLDEAKAILDAEQPALAA